MVCPLGIGNFSFTEERSLVPIHFTQYIVAMKKLNAAIQFDGKFYVARCLDLSVTSQGSTIEEAKSNLAEAIELYLETWRVGKPPIHIPALP